MEKKDLPGGESNPGLPRDRRGYSPLYYRGLGTSFREITIYKVISIKLPYKPSIINSFVSFVVALYGEK